MHVFAAVELLEGVALPGLMKGPLEILEAILGHPLAGEKPLNLMSGSILIPMSFMEGESEKALGRSLSKVRMGFMSLDSI